MLVVSSLRTVLFNFVLSDRGEHYTRTTSNLEITAIHSLFYPNIPIYFFFFPPPFLCVCVSILFSVQCMVQL